MKRPTTLDIARAAGVSKGAVSFALNGRRGVSEQTRARVKAVAEQLGWEAGGAARALSDGRAGGGGPRHRPPPRRSGHRAVLHDADRRHPAGTGYRSGFAARASGAGSGKRAVDLPAVVRRAPGRRRPARRPADRRPSPGRARRTGAAGRRARRPARPAGPAVGVDRRQRGDRCGVRTLRRARPPAGAALPAPSGSPTPRSVRRRSRKPRPGPASARPGSSTPTTPTSAGRRWHGEPWRGGAPWPSPCIDGRGVAADTRTSAPVRLVHRASTAPPR